MITDLQLTCSHVKADKAYLPYCIRPAMLPFHLGSDLVNADCRSACMRITKARNCRHGIVKDFLSNVKTHNVGHETMYVIVDDSW